MVKVFVHVVDSCHMLLAVICREWFRNRNYMSCSYCPMYDGEFDDSRGETLSHYFFAVA